MKLTIYFFILFIIFTLNSCGSDRDESTSDNQKKYYIKFKINNVQKEDYITTTQTNGSVGYFDESSIFENYNNIEYRFQLQDAIATMHIPIGQLSVTTYNWNNSTSNNSFSANLNYDDPQTNSTFIGSTILYPGSTIFPAGSNMTLKISSFANNEIKGTFSGTFIGKSGNTEKTFTITSGEFFVPLQ